MKVVISCLSVFLVVGSGCSQFTGGGGTWSPNDWDRISPSITAATEWAARTALQNSKVGPYVPEICSTMTDVSNVLSEFDDPNATFDKIREVALDAVRDKLGPGPVRDTAVLVVDQILNMAFLYARDKYSDFIDQDQNRTMLIVSRAVAKGVQNACADMNLSSFEFTSLPDVSR